MKSKIIIELSNEYEIARLISLVEDGKRMLVKEGRTQRGIDGYTQNDLDRWYNELSKRTNVRCEFVH